MIAQPASVPEPAPRESGTSGTDRDPRRILRSAALFTVAISVFGLLAAWRLEATGLAVPDISNIYFRLFALYERPYLILLGLFAAATAAAVADSRKEARPTASRSLWLLPPSGTQVGLVAAAVLAAGIATSYVVMHGLLFSMDEFSADFQAQIFAHGEYAAAVPLPWRAIGAAIAPVFVRFDAGSGRMMSMYLPVYSLLKAPFVALGISALLNPLLSAMSILVLARVARRLWPADGALQWTAIGLLATSSQVIATSGTGYAMPAHLLLNLVWLLLFLRGDTRSWRGALIVGFLDLGLHNPFPHALFVAPFLLTLLRQRRWSRLGSALMVYGLGGVFWLAWLRFVNPVTGASQTGLLTLFALPDPATLALHMMNVSLVFTWHAPAFAILLLAALAHPRELETPFGELALGVLITLLFFMLYPSTQGHGWGYRYIYQLLGSLSLLGATGLTTMRAAMGDRRTSRWLAAGFGIALLVQIPLRLRDVESFVRPFAAGYAYAKSRDADVVLVHGDSIWYGRDIVRNDPYLRAPVMVRASILSADGAQLLARRFPNRILDLSDEELLRLGMTRQRKID